LFILSNRFAIQAHVSPPAGRGGGLPTAGGETWTAEWRMFVYIVSSFLRMKNKERTHFCKFGVQLIFVSGHAHFPILFTLYRANGVPLA
jgi:hypothetical protein